MSFEIVLSALPPATLRHDWVALDHDRPVPTRRAAHRSGRIDLGGLDHASRMVEGQKAS
jgi:hypothetical protein